MADPKKKPKTCTDEIPDDAEDIAAVERARLGSETRTKDKDPKSFMLKFASIQFELACALAGRSTACMEQAKRTGIDPWKTCPFTKNRDLCGDLVDVIMTHGLSRVDTVLSLMMVLDHLMAEGHSQGIASASERTGKDPREVMLEMEHRMGEWYTLIDAFRELVDSDPLTSIALVRYMKALAMGAKIHRDDETGAGSADN